MTINTPAGHIVTLAALQDGALLRLHDPATGVTFVTVFTPAQARELAAGLVVAAPAAALERRAHPRMAIAPAIDLSELPGQ